MRKGFLIFSLAILFQCGFVFSISGQGFLINQVRTFETRNAFQNKNYGDIEGSPYYKDVFTESMVFLHGGDSASALLRYDIFQDEMEFRRGETTIWLDKKDIKSIRYGFETMIVSCSVKDTGKLAYFFLKNEGKYLLLYRKNMILLPEEPPRGYAAAIPERFKSGSNEIFIGKANMPVKRIRNKKELAEFFNDDRTVQDFIKREKIKADNLEDLSKLVSFLNGT